MQSTCAMYRTRPKPKKCCVVIREKKEAGRLAVLSEDGVDASRDIFRWDMGQSSTVTNMSDVKIKKRKSWSSWIR